MTPRHASRCVSLIPFEKNVDLVSSKSEVWPETHTFLAMGKGDIAEHAILLCSLLLGIAYAFWREMIKFGSL
jgi:hypothetical protein